MRDFSAMSFPSVIFSPSLSWIASNLSSDFMSTSKHPTMMIEVSHLSTPASLFLWLLFLCLFLLSIQCPREFAVDQKAVLPHAWWAQMVIKFGFNPHENDNFDPMGVFHPRVSCESLRL